MVHPLVTRKRDAQDRFLVAYAELGTMVAAADATDITTRCAQLWAQREPSFKDRLNDAKEVHTQSLERLMFRRLSSPEKNTGSDVLLMFALKSRRPEVYREVAPLPPDSARSLLDSLKGALQSGATVDVKALQVTVSQDDTVPDTKQPELLPELDSGL